MSVPAGIMQALQRGGASGVGPEGAPASIQLPPDAGTGAESPDASGTKGDGDWETDLQAALAALRELANDATDHSETNVIDKCIAALSGLTAKRQAGAESALGVTPAHKAMSRAGY